MTHKEFKIIVQAQTIPERFSRVLLIFSSSYQYEYFACHKFPLHHFSLLTLPYDCFCLCFESKVRLNLTAKTLPRLWLNICSIVRVGEPSFNLQILHLQLVLYIPREDYCLSEGRRIFTISW